MFIKYDAYNVFLHLLILYQWWSGKWLLFHHAWWQLRRVWTDVWPVFIELSCLYECTNKYVFSYQKSHKSHSWWLCWVLCCSQILAWQSWGLISLSTTSQSRSACLYTLVSKKNLILCYRQLTPEIRPVRQEKNASQYCRRLVVPNELVKRSSTVVCRKAYKIVL